MKRLLPVLNIIALLWTIATSYLSVTGIFNGNTMAIQSARYPTLFTPAPWAFSIWGLIYIALGAFVIFQARVTIRPQNRSQAQVAEEAKTLQGQISGWFLLTCIANSCWVLAWMYDQVGLSVLIMIVLLFALFKIILRTGMELTDPPMRIIASVWWPFCLYSGWITVALLANISAWLVKIRWNGLGAEPLAIIMTLIAGAVYLFMTWRRNMREYGLVGVWALIAVAMADRDRAPAVTVTAFIVAGILFISSSIHAYRNRAYSPFRKR
ncbi:MAG TPA: hypothetical protein VGN00_13255 [Puia sp.]|jgi:hypothetical protein